MSKTERFFIPQIASRRAALGLFLAAAGGSVQAALLEEIVVTAQKKSQSATDVPMSIQAFSGDTLESYGVSNASDLVQITPGLTYARSSTNTPIFTLRGVGFNTSNLSSTSAVGLYVDEVAYAYPYMANGALFDLERIEVLKGPQGTLYGRNTTGGLINFITNKPGEEFEAGLKLEMGNYETTNIEGFISSPIGDDMGLRIAARRDSRKEGFQESVTRDDKNGEQEAFAIRANFSWDISEKVSLLLSGSYWKDKSDSIAGQIVGDAPDEPDFILPEVAAIPLDRDWDNDTADWQEGDGPFGLGLETDSDFYSISARFDYDITANLSLVSLTAFNAVDRVDGNDFDGTSSDIFYLHSEGKVDSFSQELRLVGSFYDFEYIVGAYYSKDEIKDNQIGSWTKSSGGEFLRFVAQNSIDPGNALYSSEQYAVGFNFFRLNLESESESASIFSKVDYDYSEHVQLSLGLRYTDDELRSVSCSADYSGNTLPIWNTSVWAGAGNTTFPGPVDVNECMTLTPDLNAVADANREPLKEDNVAGRFSVKYTFSDDLLMFGSLSRGYKSGAWPVLTAATSDQLDAATQERVTAYELGIKAALFENRAQLNGSIFYYDYKDKQLLSEVEDIVFQTLPRLVNIPKSSIAGVELEFNAQLTENLATFLAASYIKSEVEEFSGYRRLGDFDDFEGDAFPYTPEWQFTGAVSYVTDFIPSWNLASNLSVSYRSDTSAAIGDEIGFEIDAYSLVNADITLSTYDDKWAVGVYARNLLDTYYWTSVDVQTDSVFRIPGFPREYGLRLGYAF